MSAATFTPGPWIVTADVDGPRIQSVEYPLGEVWGPLRAADARLIAAAPELLEACKLAYARLKPGDIRKDYAGHVAHVAMAKAINKAEGREP